METSEKDNVIPMPNQEGKPKTLFTAKNEVNENGLPGVGVVDGPGLLINFADPFKKKPETEEELKAAENEEPGTTPSLVLAAVEARLLFIQKTGAATRENALAVTKVQEAIMWLKHVPLVQTKVEAPVEAPKG